jgi:mono/diheme cytochrome c family protein
MKALKSALIPALALLVCACGNTSTVTTNQNQPQVAQSAPVATPDELAAARANFQKHCAGCHGEKADGGVKTIDGHKFKVPSLREGHALTHPDDKFVKQITEGDEEMPAFKDKLKPEEIKDLVRFIRKEFQGKQ